MPGTHKWFREKNSTINLHFYLSSKTQGEEEKDRAHAVKCQHLGMFFVLLIQISKKPEIVKLEYFPKKNKF
jgi:hypothetical protein